MTSDRRSIPTRYKNILFRSKLEADWARALDRLAIPWEHEKEGRYFGEVFYLPDFWLPRSRQFLEVKVVWEPDDCRKAMAMLEHLEPRPFCRDRGCVDIPLIAAFPDGQFSGWARRVGRFKQSKAGDFHAFLLDRSRAVQLAQCSRCEGWWFFDPEAQWPCQCCGHTGGVGHFAELYPSPLPWAA